MFDMPTGEGLAPEAIKIVTASLGARVEVGRYRDGFCCGTTTDGRTTCSA